ncbi:probable quinone oxidoreductase [[Candida] jaroonii]|uniref:Probable quinone oxidoreductase n=1 Tax=[Candida] jaroonii TaxID=467808 RepID=A0ACA9Y277_9ASCO|nr:probable quinone oxidoreductase [[Candida] jaroonii]
MSIPQTQKVVLIDGNSDTFEVVKYADSPVPKISSSDILVKNLYAGVNFIEAYFRKGYYPAQFPYTLGREASAEVVQVGDEVTNYKVGDKVIYTQAGSFAQYSKIDSKSPLMSKLPDNVTNEQLKLYGSMLIQTTTAYTFAEETYNVQPNDYCLVWAAAGGVGQVLVQILHARGAKVIALASSDDKLQLSKELGADYVINYKTEDVVAKVKEFTNGEGVRVSFDSVGAATWQTSIDSLAVGGHFISYGNSSGKVDPISIYSLTPKCLTLSRPTRDPYMRLPGKYDYYFGKILGDLDTGVLKLPQPQEYKLGDYVEVAKLLESGKTTGKFVLNCQDI